MRRRRGDPVDGVLLLDKPVGITSNDAVQHARRLLGAARCGHTGTLDPLASGLLPLAFGEATKFTADLLDADKVYVADIALGATTTTGDAEGVVLVRRPVTIDGAAVALALARFRGTLAQVPPMHSALKRDGRPLYDYARAGIVLERTARTITIHRLDLRWFDPHAARLQVEVACSKGTYVRVLAEDLGEALGCGAHLAGLRRTAVSALQLAAAIDLPALEALGIEARRARLLPADALLATLPRVDLDEAAAARLRRGQRIALPACPPADGRSGGAAPEGNESTRHAATAGEQDGGHDPDHAADGAGRRRVRAYAPLGRLLGTGWVGGDGMLAPQRLISEQERT
jgi:tRNA pseudouridine55 synthase